MKVPLTRPFPNPRLLPIQLDLLRADVRIAFDDLLDLLPEELTSGGRVLFLQDEVSEVRRCDVGGGGEDGVDVVESFLWNQWRSGRFLERRGEAAYLVAKVLQRGLNELTHSLAFDLALPKLRTKPEDREKRRDKTCSIRSARALRFGRRRRT